MGSRGGSSGTGGRGAPFGGTAPVVVNPDEWDSPDDLWVRENRLLDETLSREEKRALHSYIGDGYKDINRFWRDQPHTRDLSEAEVLEYSRHLDRMTSTPTTKSLVVYRGSYDPALLSVLEVGRGVGTVYQEKAYSSTSARNSAANDFDARMLFRISVPRGSPAAVLGTMTEREVLLPRNTKFKIRGVTTRTERGRDRYYVDMEVIP